LNPTRRIKACECFDVPVERQARDDAHQIDKDDRREADGSRAAGDFRVKLQQARHDPDLFEEIEELVEEAGVTEVINLRHVLARRQIQGNAGLVFGGRLKGESTGDVSGGGSMNGHGRHFSRSCRERQIGNTCN
jgi:hypothetical protein